MKISIVCVNWHASDFADLLVRSVAKFTKNEYEIIIIDNSNSITTEELVEWNKITLGGGKVNAVKMPKNYHHGAGLDKGINEVATGDYVMVLDIDSHILLQDWDQLSVEILEASNQQLIACEGGLLKPVRPCGMFFRRKFFIDNKMSFKARNDDGAKDDVGIHFYRKTLSLGFGVKFMNYSRTNYRNVIGNEYGFGIASEPVLYHNWYGTRWYDTEGKVRHQVIDNKIRREDFIVKKESLLNQALDALK